jgi:hypothetical protein
LLAREAARLDAVSGFVVIVFGHDSKILTPGSRRALSWRARVRLRTHTDALVLPQGDQGIGMPGFQGFRLQLLVIQRVQLVGKQIEQSSSRCLDGETPVPVSPAECHQLVVQVFHGANLGRLVLMTTSPPWELTGSDFSIG